MPPKEWKLAAAIFIQNLWHDVCRDLGVDSSKLLRRMQRSWYRMIKDDVAKARFAKEAFEDLQGSLKVLAGSSAKKALAEKLLRYLRTLGRRPNPVDLYAVAIEAKHFSSAREFMKTATENNPLVRGVGSARARVWWSTLRTTFE